MIDPRLKILYVLLVGVAAFATSLPAVLLALLALQLVLWFAVRLPAQMLWRSLSRLAVLIAFIVLSFAFFGAGEGDRIEQLGLFGLTLPVNVTGLVEGLLRSSRIVTVILASQLVQRTGDRKAFVQGLRGLRVPEFVAYSMDLLLEALGPSAGGGGGGGGGGGRGRKKSAEASAGFEFRRLLRGDVGALGEMIERNVARIRERSAQHDLSPALRSDLAVIVGLAAVAMTLRFLQVLPGLPVAPGHKGIILIPLYVLAAAATRSRWGGTQLGLIVGITSFMMGMGRFGPFDILRHLTPGLFVDLALPLVTGLFRQPNAWVFALLGVGAAVTRVTTLAAIAAFAGAPPAFYALLLPSVATNVVFGFLSGFVTFPLMRFAGRLRSGASEQRAEPIEGPAPPED